MNALASASIEREVLLTGIGGQGVQLAAKILAHAATLEAREVVWLGTYGGTMRGGNTEATVVVGEGEIVSPPIVSRAWSALVVHPRHFGDVAGKMRADGVVFADADLIETPLEPLLRASEEGKRAEVVAVPATQIARDVDAPKAASLVLLGAFAQSTGIVSSDSLASGLEASLPSYRQQTLETNRRALLAGERFVSEKTSEAEKTGGWLSAWERPTS